MAIKDKLQSLLVKVTGKDIKGDNVEEVIADAAEKYEGSGSTTYEHNIGFRFKKSSDTVQGMVRVYTKSNVAFTAETFLDYLKQHHNGYKSMDSVALNGTFIRNTNVWLYSMEYNYMNSTDCYAFSSAPGTISVYGAYNCMEYFYDNIVEIS